MAEEEIEAHILGVIVVEHYSMKEGIEPHYSMNTYEPKHTHDLTTKEREEALALLLFIIEKRDDTIKARLVGDRFK